MNTKIIILGLFLLIARYCEDSNQDIINEGKWIINNRANCTVLIDKGEFEPSNEYRISILYPNENITFLKIKNKTEGPCSFEDLWNNMDDTKKREGLKVKLYSTKGVLLNEWKWPEDTDRKGSFFDKDRWAEHNDSRKSIRSYWWAFELKPEDLHWPDEI